MSKMTDERFFNWVMRFQKEHGRLPKGYVAGPMTLFKDLPKDNPMRWGRYAFEEAARQLRKMFPGIDLFVPIEQDDKEGGPDVVFGTCSWAEVLGKDLAILGPRDFVVLLPDWNNSKGAILESNFAQGEHKALFRAIMFRPGLDSDLPLSKRCPGTPVFSNLLAPQVIQLGMPDSPCHGYTEGNIGWNYDPRGIGEPGSGPFISMPVAAVRTSEPYHGDIEVSFGIPASAGGAGGKSSDLMKPTNPKDRAATDRLDLSLFPDTALCYGALAMQEGDMKYGGYNYRPGGVLASVYVAACRRHIAKWFNGEEEDPTTQVPHLANAIACLAVLVDSVECGTLKDDRPPHAVDMENLFEKMRAKVKFLQSKLPCTAPRYAQKTHPMQPKKA